MLGENGLESSVVIENATSAVAAAGSAEDQPPAGGGGSGGGNDPPHGTLLWLDEHLNVIKNEIIGEAKKKADKKRRPVEPRDVVDATEQFAPGERLTPPLGKAIVDFLSRVSASITGVTIVAAILAVVFGVIGLSSNQGPELSNSALDIAKIFAGAIVGSTTATVAANLK